MTEVNDKDLINLKEAAKISGYSADYIGQLIRAGKISGKQVYCNVQWMTTAEAVMEYKSKGSNIKETGKIKSSLRKIGMELNILKLFFKTFKTAMPILIFLSFCFIVLVLFVFASLNAGRQEINQNNNQTNKTVTF